LHYWAKFPALERLFGADEARRIGAVAAADVAEIGQFCQANGIDADYRRSGWLWGATCAAHSGAWNPVLEALARFQAVPFQEMSAKDIAGRWGIDGLTGGGVLEPTCATVQPAKLARGLRRVALQRGVRLYERSPMFRLVRGARPAVVTARGTLNADKVVLAMNAWAAGFRELRRSFVVVASDAAITPPIPDRLAAMGWSDGPAVTDSRAMIVGLRPTVDGRVKHGKGNGAMAFGGDIGTFYDGLARRLDLMRKEFAQAVPRLADVPTAETWSGPIDRTAAGLPYFGPLPGSATVFFGVGFSGNGVGPTRLGGRILASLAQGVRDEWSSMGLVRAPENAFPPGPFRAIGGALVRRAVMRQDRLDHAGRAADPITRALVRLVPGGVAPTVERRAP
ncbi:MAG: NAD(P)/FAD-dependent oxidoreductase, partial [Alphaproteobacteria bacterium]